MVERDHPFLDMDSLQALFRRLSTLNRMARMRSEKASRRRAVHPGDMAAASGAAGAGESEDEDQECALSDQWTFQRHSRRWSRIVDLLPGDQQGSLEGSGSSATGQAAAGAEPMADEEQSKQERPEEASGERTPSTDPVILGSFRRSSSERLRHGAKNFLRRMESLRSRSGRRRPPTRPEGTAGTGALVIGSPQVLDPAAMEDRMRDRNWVDLSPTGSAPSPDSSNAQLFVQQQSPTSHETPSGTPSPAGSLKTAGGKSGGSMSRSFFGRRSFRPSTSTSSAASTDDPKDASGAHSDSECSPSYSPRRRRDANSNETGKPLPAASATTTSEPSPRGRLYLNFNAKSSLSGRTKKSGSASSVLASPDDEAGARQPPGSNDTTPTPSGSLREGERLLDALLNGSAPDANASPGAGSSPSIAPSGSGSPRAPIVVRWHSFRRSSSTGSSTNSLAAVTSAPPVQQQPSPSSSTPDIASLSVGQFALLRKLALLRLTALLERHTSSSKPSWGWDLPKFMRKTKSPDYKGSPSSSFPAWMKPFKNFLFVSFII